MALIDLTGLEGEVYIVVRALALLVYHGLGSASDLVLRQGFLLLTKYPQPFHSHQGKSWPRRERRASPSLSTKPKGLWLDQTNLGHLPSPDPTTVCPVCFVEVPTSEPMTCEGAHFWANDCCQEEGLPSQSNPPFPQHLEVGKSHSYPIAGTYRAC